MYSSLSLTQFRSYHDAYFELSPNVTIVVGPNGSGKTNLLEAVYVLSQGSSFRVADKDLIAAHETWFRIEGQFGDQRRILTYDMERQPAKQFSLDGVKKQRLTYPQRVPLVLFEPDELRLLQGSPQRRRDYIDGCLSRLWPDAGTIRGRFERTLLQRNNIIKHAHTRPLSSLEDELFVWDIKLAEYAAALVNLRLQLVKLWNNHVSDTYSRLAGRQSHVIITYRSDVDTSVYKTSFLQRLHHNRQQDVARGFTTVGPHRDDISIELDGQEAALSASRGEVRSLVLSLKLTELALLEAQHDRPPLLLLDDVFSELDTSRRLALANLAMTRQTIITTTDIDSIAVHFPDSYGIIETHQLR